MTIVAASTEQPTRRRLSTVQDVAACLDVPVSTVYELARSNRIPGVVRVGRSVRFNLDVVERWIAEGGEK